MTERRILLVGRPHSGKLTFLKALAGSLPPQTTDSHAGLSHTLKIDTQYYKADIGVWVDEFTESAEWTKGYLAKEAKEVREVLGAFIYTFKRPQNDGELATIKEDLKSLARIVKACGYQWDGVCLAVGMPHGLQPQLNMNYDDWEDVCQDYQFEYVDFEAKGRNDYGEPTGMERLNEALQANDWAGGGINDDDILGSIGSDGDVYEAEEDLDGNVKGGLKLEANEMEREMFSLHQAIYGGGESNENDDDIEVEKLENAVMKLQAVRDMASDLPEAERRKIAAKAVADIMKTI